MIIDKIDENDNFKWISSILFRTVDTIFCYYVYKSFLQNLFLK